MRCITAAFSSFRRGDQDLSTVKQYQCLNCKAGLEYDPPSGRWKCHYCFSSFNKEDLDQTQTQTDTEAAEELNEDMPELDSYHCSNCGAELIADETVSATSCIYCKSPAIIKSRLAGTFKPKFLIPFRLTKKQAEELYADWIRKRIFTPKEFKINEEIKKLSGIYAPYWLFDCKVAGEIQGEATMVRSWRSGNYRYTNTKYYHVARQGTAEYDKVPVDASKKLNDELMHLIEPYDYKELTDFTMQYLSGFLAEKYDVEEPQASEAMQRRVDEFFETRLNGTVKGYSTYNTESKHTVITDKVSNYSLLPVYLLIKKYKDKEHTFIINGQTGKIAGEAPISIAKVFAFGAAVFAAIWSLLVFGGALIG